MVEIQLRDYGNIEVQDGVNVPLVFNIDNIKNFGQRKSSFSKTIKIPGSKSNNDIFNHIYEIKGDGSFNMTVRHDCILLVDKNPIMVGFMKLAGITKLDNMIMYDVNIFDEVKNLFADIGTKKLRDLDFSSGFTFKDITYYTGDHTYDIPTIRTNFLTATNYTNVYEYTLINHGYNVSGNWPWKSVSLSQLYPSVYVKAIVDKIFYDVGWTYSSDYLDGTTYDGIFKIMMNNYNGSQIFTNIGLSQYVSVSKWDNFTYGFEDTYFTHGGTLNMSYEYNDNLFGERYYKYEVDDYSYEDHGMQVPKDGFYTIKLFIDVKDYIEGDQACYTASEYILKYKRLDPSTSGFTSHTIESWNTWDDFIVQSPSISETIIIKDIELKRDDIIYFILTTGTWGISPGGSGNCPYAIPVPFKLNCISFETIYQLEGTDLIFVDLSGTTIPLNQFLPDMTQVDFLRNLIKLNNLYLWKSKTDTNEKLLHIDPRDEFYTDGGLEDWSSQVDYNKKIDIKDLSLDISKENIFTFTKSDDYYNKLYFDKYNETYGTKNNEVNNDYLMGKKETKVDWTSLQWYYKSDGVPVRIMDLEAWFDELSEIPPYLGLYFPVSFTSSSSGINLGGGDTNDNLFRIQYAPHVRNYGGAWWDLNFKTNNALDPIADWINWDEKNMYNVFWENYMDTITDVNARRVTYYINLTLKDIIKLDFRNIIQIDGQYYILEKIDYDPTKNSSSKVTLLKLKGIKQGDFTRDYVLYNDTDYVLYNDENDRVYYN